ncbi:adenosylmethionine--8-amino-7-oxononanoate aminotransferase BioA [Adhaeribacter aerolatus]|uniref:Adenosylmethionine-8-amino-7-oxononanoate aminotransferase n=1 Tax=Adhaeribacter aerolatus TaxID=670289 RepID=A0A512B088_9BACT|nr:adenosylmethionine--8-amino-7-oxononanoate transaminase [Adhaeribacter aerolatus]GEO05374.1 adenosylmethionine--8-amino-7-oxononanoate aminotransferase BioA [Adhaeribacter aerolatus]
MMNLSQRDQEIIWHPYTQMQTAAPPLPITRGEGALLYNESGHTYIDAISSWWVNLHGHCHPHITQKISEQLNRLDHVIFAGFTHEPAVKLAENLLEILPANQAKVFYSDNGSTAVEVALKMAMQYWQNQGQKKSKIIAFRDSYHGDTFGAMSVSSRSAFTQPFQEYLFEVLFIDVPVQGREEETIRQLKELAQQPDIAAFIFEPLVLGTAGMVMYEPEVLNSLLQICKGHSILSIADEVMTGFGRTGHNFACDYLTEQPDMVCLSKGLTGGVMALGVTTCSAEIFEAFLGTEPHKTFFHGHSYTANPIACTAGIASYELLVQPETQQNIQRIVAQHQQFARRLRENPLVKNIRQTGTILALEFNTGQTSYFNQIRNSLYNFALQHQVLLRPLGNIIYILPPYCITDEQLATVYGVIDKMSTLLQENAKAQI